MKENTEEKEIIKEYLQHNTLLTPELLAKIRSGSKTEPEPSIQVLFDCKEQDKKPEVEDFISYFNKRYHEIRQVLQNRQEMNNLTSINRIKHKTERSDIAIIGMIMEKATTKNGHVMLSVEDNTGTIKVLLNKNNTELMTFAGSIVLDDIIGIIGTNGDNIIFTNKIILPDILPKNLKKSPDEAYAIFLSDLHVGSKMFLGNQFEKFISWINGELGNEKQKQATQKIKYLFIAGDIVDGCGVYPNQDSELDIKDITKQYEESARLLKKIPERIKIIICPGNHDAMHVAEPQPALYREYAESLWEMPNVTLVSNPSLIRMHASPSFPGFDVLMYHGYSFDYYAANVDTIRNQGGYDRADLIMKFLLQRRHLAPTYTSTQHIPYASFDPLVIKKSPDFFITGHIHKTAATNYRNTTLICGSCWQSKTPFQEKVGHHPEPCRVPLVNLNTREIRILKF